MGFYDVELYGVPAHKMPGVRTFLQREEEEAAGDTAAAQGCCGLAQ